MPVSMKRFLKGTIKLVLTSGLLAGVIYVSTDAFESSWRGFVIKEMAAHGLHLDFSRLVLNPVGGIVASDVRVFDDADHKRVLVAMDRLNLNFNLGKLMEKQFVLEGLELSHTNVTLPVDPESDSPTVIKIEDLSARAFLTEGRLELHPPPACSFQPGPHAMCAGRRPVAGQRGACNRRRSERW